MAVRKTIFVTGGGSGIGRAIAIRFAHAGWFVGLGDVNAAGMAATEALMPGGFAYSHKFDVTDRTAWDEALRIVSVAAGGRIDVVANNAGVPLGGRLDELTQQEIDRTLDVNLRGAIYGAQASYRYLKESAPGSCLLNTASAAGIYGTPGASIYAATKAGLRSLTESLDGEWAEDGIRVRSLMPSYIDTPLLSVPPNAAQIIPIRDIVARSGLEFTPVEEVAEAAWQAVTDGKPRLHRVVGKTARQMQLAARWFPGRLRERARKLAMARDALTER